MTADCQIALCDLSRFCASFIDRPATSHQTRLDENIRPLQAQSRSAGPAIIQSNRSENRVEHLSLLRQIALFASLSPKVQNGYPLPLTQLLQSHLLSIAKAQGIPVGINIRAQLQEGNLFIGLNAVCRSQLFRTVVKY